MRNDERGSMSTERPVADELCEEIEHLEHCGVPLTAVTRLRRIAERMRGEEGGRYAA
jgi:hypothetical protein